MSNATGITESGGNVFKDLGLGGADELKTMSKRLAKAEAELAELRAKAEVRAEPDAYLFWIRRKDRAGCEFAAIDYVLDDGEELLSKTPLFTAPPAQAVSANWEEAHRIIGRLISSDPDFEDCTAAADFIRRLAADQSGPDGFATWKDAAIAERAKRVAAEKAQAVSVPEGWKLVPIEPSIRQIRQGTWIWARNETADMAQHVREIYEVMLDAAPSPEPPC